MDLDYATVVVFAKTFGLLYLVVMSIGVVLYTYSPSRKKQYNQAAKTILEDEDKPWR